MNISAIDTLLKNIFWGLTENLYFKNKISHLNLTLGTNFEPR